MLRTTDLVLFVNPISIPQKLVSNTVPRNESELAGAATMPSQSSVHFSRVPYSPWRRGFAPRKLLAAPPSRFCLQLLGYRGSSRKQVCCGACGLCGASVATCLIQAFFYSRRCTRTYYPGRSGAQRQSYPTFRASGKFTPLPHHSRTCPSPSSPRPGSPEPLNLVFRAHSPGP